MTGKINIARNNTVIKIYQTSKI